MFKKSIIALALALSSALVLCAPGEVDPHNATGGNALRFPNIRLPASNQPNLLPNKVLTESDRDIINQAESMFDRNASLSIVMIEKGQLVFEKYKAPASPRSLNFSWSMSKSLTAYTIGAMMCEGKILDLNKPAQTYSPDLKGTVYGEATVKNLLTMGSGARVPPSTGILINKQPGTCVWGVDCDSWQLIRSGIMSNLAVIKHDPDRDTSSWGRPVTSGSRFAYNGNDTSSLSNIAEQNGGFIESFNKHIWSQIGSQGPGHWLVDKDNKAVAMSGFSATSKDWGRLAMLTIKQLKSKDTCIGNFMKEATTEQLPNLHGIAGKAFKGYGYQTWIMDGRSTTPSYWWVGFGGQRVGVDPVSERIIVVTSSREDYMDEIYRIFQRWQKQ